MPVGSGKSLISLTLLRELEATVITPQNLLVDQYARDYPEINTVKGAEHYRCCSHPTLSCAEVKQLALEKIVPHCMNCHYERVKARMAQEPSIFNPMSFYFNKKYGGVFRSNLFVIDEAHSLLDMLKLVATFQFPADKFTVSERTSNEVDFIEFMHKTYEKMNKLYKFYLDLKDVKMSAAIYREMSRLRLVSDEFQTAPERFVVTWYPPHDRVVGKLVVTPVVCPKRITEHFFQGHRVIMMSGTLFPSDVEELAQGAPYSYHSLTSPIPASRRPVYRTGTLTACNKDTTTAELVGEVGRWLTRYPEENTIIHTTYQRAPEMAKGVQKLFPNRKVYVFEKNQKINTVEKFKQTGGILIAAGCAEGLDLTDDLARLTLIPCLDQPNLGDIAVRKRKAMIGGEAWYRQQVLKQTLQRLGRTTRHQKDFSLTVISDPGLSGILKTELKYVPKDFLDALKLSEEPPLDIFQKWRKET